MRYLYPLLFFIFICWIIRDADAGASNWFLTFVRMIPYGDKLGHVGLYGVLALLLNVALRCRTMQLQRFHVQIGSVMVLTFALIEELSQGIFPSRTLDGMDVVADVIGVAMASYFAKWVYGNYLQRCDEKMS